MSETTKTAVILGGASTVARALAATYAQAGYALVLADIDYDEVARIAADTRLRHNVACEPLYLDATAFDQHNAFVGQCAEKLGGDPEGVLLCLGYMPAQEDAQARFELARRAFDTNLTGSVSLLERFAARFEKRGHGFIVGLSSVAGDRGRRANYIYGATKAGMTCYLSGLRNRLSAAGVQVLTVKPGFMDTKMTYGMPLPGPLTASPEAAAQAIFRAQQRGKDVAYVTFLWRYIMLIITSIPEWKFKKMNI
ncbi:SDR family oxidoreductase [Roseovarius pacificus]|uniref:SDR family oxidoreductase n=1 Tax=Roseovarius pacificus TaxID=337701 RepID=UPI002A18A111|nr:SDR family oxidoreductase [Roseovarius pacificus]